MKPELLDGYYNAQVSVIGSMLIDDRCIPLVLSKMSPDDFADGTCKATFCAIQKLILAGRPADPVTVLDAMQGGDAYARWIKEAMELTPTAANVDAYIGIAKDGAAMAALRAGADMILNGCASLDEAREQLRKMSAAQTDLSRGRRYTAAELAKDFIGRMSMSKPEYLPWGIPKADSTVNATLGDYILLGGYPSSGKTMLSLQMALAQAGKYRVGYYSLETQADKIADRTFSHLTGVPLSTIKRRTFGPNEWPKFAEAADRFVSETPFDIIQASGFKVEDIISDAIAKQYEIIYVDYIQLIDGEKNERPYERVSRVSRALKIFGTNHKVAMVLLSQFNRPEKTMVGGEKQMVPPDMSAFRESGQLEQDADAAFLLWPKDPLDNYSRRVLKLGKNKEGVKFSIEMSFNGATQTLAEIPERRPSDYYGENQSQFIDVSESDTSENAFEGV